jgi:hypothetical protein
MGRNYLVKNLALCTPKQQDTFKLMYGRHYGLRSVDETLTMTFEDVVAEIPENKIEWAMQQVASTLTINAGKGEAQENTATQEGGEEDE